MKMYVESENRSESLKYDYISKTILALDCLADFYGTNYTDIDFDVLKDSLINAVGGEHRCITDILTLLVEECKNNHVK